MNITRFKGIESATRLLRLAATPAGRAILVVAAVGAFTCGCKSVRRGEAVGRPVNISSSAVERGQVVFQQHCYRCHPGGEAGLGPALNNKPAPVFLMKTQVRAGFGAMPRFDTHIIPQKDLDDLMAYVMALRKADKPEKHEEEKDK